EVRLPQFAVRLPQSFARRDRVVQDQVLVGASSSTFGAIESLPVHDGLILWIRISCISEPTPVPRHRSGHFEVRAVEDVRRWWSEERSADVRAEQEIDIESMNGSIWCDNIH